jgi:Dyp-type peroxidase family
MTIEWDDIQGHILRAYKFTRARFLVVEVTEAGGGLRWLRDLVAPEVVAPPVGERQPPGHAVNVAFSHAGLAALDTDPEVLAAFPEEHRQGMWARAALLGDTDWERGWVNQPALGPHDRERVTAGTGGPPPAAAHVFVAIHADDRGEIDTVDGRIRPRADTPGVRLAGRIDVAVLEADAEAHGVRATQAGPHDAGRSYRREHFGFADGLSQPRIAGVSAPPGPSTDTGWQWWRRPKSSPNPIIQPGEFVLGYPDEDNPDATAPEPRALFRNGSYLVVRKLGQDVGAFRELVATTAAQARLAGDGDVDPAEVAAAMMGRGIDGVPLVEPPTAGDPNRDFSFRSDPDGQRCPLGSHVRRANPRDGLTLGASAVNRHRVLRRSLPYGPPAPPERTGDDGGRGDDGAERGIIFLAYGASIGRQFEFVQRWWLNDGDALGIGHRGDPVSGAPGVEATVTVPGRGRWPRRRPLVIPHGGEYFFAPGLSALRRLALGQWRARSASSVAGPEPAALAPSARSSRPGFSPVADAT